MARAGEPRAAPDIQPALRFISPEASRLRDGLLAGAQLG